MSAAHVSKLVLATGETYTLSREEGEQLARALLARRIRNDKTRNRDLPREIAAFLDHNPASSTTEIARALGARDSRVRRILQTDPRFQNVPAGPGAGTTEGLDCRSRRITTRPTRRDDKLRHRERTAVNTGLVLTLPDEFLAALAERVERMAREIAAAQTAQSPWLDVAAAATYLCTTDQAIRAAVKRGQLPGKRPNGRVLFTRDELDRYVTQGVSMKCGSCGLDFSSIRAFDTHRVGKPGYTHAGRACDDPTS